MKGKRQNKDSGRTGEEVVPGDKGDLGLFGDKSYHQSPRNKWTQSKASWNPVTGSCQDSQGIGGWHSKGSQGQVCETLGEDGNSDKSPPEVSWEN